MGSDSGSEISSHTSNGIFPCSYRTDNVNKMVLERQLPQKIVELSFTVFY